MENIELTDAQLIEMAKKTIAKRNETSAKWRNYNLRTRWANDQYKKFAIENDFIMPETPTDDELEKWNATIDKNRAVVR